MKAHHCAEWDLVAEFPDGRKLLYLDQNNRSDLVYLIKSIRSEQRKRKRAGERSDYLLRSPIGEGELVDDPR